MAMIQADMESFSEVDSIESVPSPPSSMSGCTAAAVKRQKRKRRRGNPLKLEVSLRDVVIEEPMSGLSVSEDQAQDDGEGNAFYFIVRKGTGRKSCEDLCVVDSHNLYFSVFDGHGGFGAAEFSAPRLMQKIICERKNPMEAFMTTDQEFIQAENFNGRADGVIGTTALTMHVEDGLVHIAYVGDSRAVLVSKDKVTQLTMDHSPTNDKEALRIQEAGGFVLGNRVNGSMAVSRALGDLAYKALIIGEPDVLTLRLRDASGMMVLATDGLWGVVTLDMVYSTLQACEGDVKLACKTLVDLALACNSTDDIGILVINMDEIAKSVVMSGRR